MDMPEGDKISRTARTLHNALAGEVVKRFETVLPKPAPMNYHNGLVGRTIENVEAQGKWLKIYFSGDLSLLTHMLMSGSWPMHRPGEAWKRRRIHHRIVIGTERFVAGAFTMPLTEFHSEATLKRRLREVRPSGLAENMEERAIGANLRAQSESEVGSASLNQAVLAGIGNVCKSEGCFGFGVNPFRARGFTDHSGDDVPVGHGS
jgi:endonuclease-8